MYETLPAVPKDDPVRWATEERLEDAEVPFVSFNTATTSYLSKRNFNEKWLGLWGQ